MTENMQADEVLRLLPVVFRGALNIKLSPSVVQGDQGTSKLISFIKAWCKLKLWHLQFNIINSETLLKARKNPEAYKSLLVRVAGYSAYFTELSYDLQEDIIQRTEHEEFGI